MQLHTQPFPETYPEFSVLENDGYCEYRTENWHLARDGTGVIISGTTLFTVRDAIMLALGIVICWKFQTARILTGGIVLLITMLWRKCTQLLHESVIVVPPHGIQFETRRGAPGFPMFTSRHFIPSRALQDIVIHEGLRGWNIRFYLAVVKIVSPATFTLEVAYQSLLPPQPVLVYVQRGIRERFHLVFKAAKVTRCSS